MKTDTKALALAYLGCFIMIAAMIIQFKYDINWHYNIIMIGCISIAGFFLVKDSQLWEYHIKKVGQNIKQKFYKYI